MLRLKKKKKKAGTRRFTVPTYLWNKENEVCFHTSRQTSVNRTEDGSGNWDTIPPYVQNTLFQLFAFLITDIVRSEKERYWTKWGLRKNYASPLTVFIWTTWSWEYGSPATEPDLTPTNHNDLTCSGLVRQSGKLWPRSTPPLVQQVDAFTWATKIKRRHYQIQGGVPSGSSI